MKQVIKFILITYIVASYGEHQEKKWTFRKKLNSIGSNEFTNDSVQSKRDSQRTEYKKVAEQWNKDRIKAGQYTYVEAKEGVNEKIVNKGLKPIIKNTALKFLKKNRRKGIHKNHNQRGLHNKLEDASYEDEINKYNNGNDTTMLENYKTTNETGNADKTKQKKAEKCTSQESELNSIEAPQDTHEPQARMVDHLDEHTMVSDDGFGYMVVVLKGSRGFLSAGALIDENWVLTSAQQVQLMRENMRFIRVRLGSVNYRKGGILLPIKDLEIHPYYKINEPNYDLALLMLAKPVRPTLSIKIIRIQLIPKELTSTHLILSSWVADLVDTKAKNTKPNLIAEKVPETIKRNPILSVTHLHSADLEECFEELSDTITDSAGLMCLETGAKDVCHRDAGAPVVVNGVLWAVISGWMLECDEEYPMPVFATVISDVNVSSWIHSTVHGHNWHVTFN